MSREKTFEFDTEEEASAFEMGIDMVNDPTVATKLDGRFVTLIDSDENPEHSRNW